MAGIGSLRLWIGKVVLVVLVLNCLGSLAGAVNLPRREFVGILEDDVSGPQTRWARPNGLSAPKTRRRRSAVEVSPSAVNGTAEADLLLEFRKGVTRDPSNVLSSWNSKNVSSYCSWTGVICSSPMGPVSALNLSGHQLTGTISPSFGGLLSLSLLDLSNNSFGGSIPIGIANCSNLTVVDLSVNVVSGGIPAQLAALSNLEELDLSSNQLTGGMPPSLSNLSALRVLSLGNNPIQGGLGSLDWGGFAHLESLNLSTNQISGSIPGSFRNCSSLLSLDLSQNYLSGIITDIFGGLPKLQYLDLQTNSLTGSIPPSLGSLNALILLALSYNTLTGSIPPSLVNCSNLASLFLDSNNLTGEIPAEIGALSRLQSLYLWGNNLKGPIPVSLMNCSSLTQLFLSSNNLTGDIPAEIGPLSKLQFLYLEGNNLTGPIPLSLMNCSSLTQLILYSNNLMGDIPAEIGSLSQLQWQYLWGNNLTGPIPLRLVNCTSLTYLILSHNSLGGEIPEQLGMLNELNYLYLRYNKFSGEIPQSLANSSHLLQVLLQGNSLTGLVPSELGLLKRLSKLDLSDNFLTGQIPPLLGGSTALISLSLAGNNLSGQIPPSIGQLINLQGLNLSDNSLSGGIPAELSNCTRLFMLDLSGNSLSENIPSELGNLTFLNGLYLSNNNLTGPISSALIQKSPGLVEISLAHNSFNGAISRFDFGSLGNLQLSLDLSHNLISGPLPSGIGALEFVQIIHLSFNAFSGGITDSFSECIGLESLDLSSNNLDGKVLESLTTLQHLTFSNVSFNQLVGPIPKLGPFANFTGGSFLGNPNLCGPMVPHHCNTTCRGIRCHKFEIILLALAASIIATLALVARWFWFIPKMSHLRGKVPSNESDLRSNLNNMIDRVATVNGSDGRFLEGVVLQTIDDPRGDNIIGRGVRSIIYKGILPTGEVFALKRLVSNNAHDQKGEESKETHAFHQEAEMLANLRHKNILKVLSFYLSSAHKALILEYMSGGSLHQHLHQMDQCILKWQTRLKITTGVAEGMKYLHHDFPEPLIHRDLKPSNILLDDNFEPKVADFGISKFVDARREDGEASASTLCGTIGYMPPEYASQPWVSTKGDVFTYGMTIIELLTRRQLGSTNVMENQGREATGLDKCGGESRGRDLRSWILDNFHERPIDLLDHSLVSECREDDNAVEQMVLLLKVGIFCTSADPKNRPSMIDVVVMLTNIVNLNREPVFMRTIEEIVNDTNP